MARQPDQPSSLQRLRQRITRFLLHDLWHFDRSQGTRLRGFLVNNARLIFLIIRGFRQHQCTTRAAALTFITVFGLVPFLAVALSVMSGFADLKAHEDKVIDFVLDRLPPATAAPDGGGGPDAAPVQDYRRALREKIVGWVGSIQYGKIGTVALVFCVGIFFKLLSSIEAAFNNIWGVKRQRTFLRKLRAYWMLAIVPLLIAAYAAMVASVGDWLASNTFLSKLFAVLSEMGFVWLAVLALYWLLPNIHVRFFAAASGALFTAILLQILKQSALLITWLFGRKADTLGEIYGSSIAIIPVFLFVIYVLWLIALFGAELSYAAQHLRGYVRDRRTLGLNQVSRERLGFRLLLAVAERFDRGEAAPSSPRLSDEFDVSMALVHDALELFERGNLLDRLTENAETVWRPARPLERIQVTEAIACMRQSDGDELPLAGTEALDRATTDLLTEAGGRVVATLEGITLQDMLDRAEQEGAPADQAE